MLPDAVTPNGIAIQLAGLPPGSFNDTDSVGSAAGDLCTQSCVPNGPDDDIEIETLMTGQ